VHNNNAPAAAAAADTSLPLRANSDFELLTHSVTQRFNFKLLKFTT
jgi:hypothetical protein